MAIKLALAIICKGSDDEAKLLDRCLSSLSPYVDGIFITRTQKPGEPKNANVSKVAKKYKAHLSDFEWVYNFAAARNFNFSQVPDEYDFVIWTDADDVWRNPENLKPTLEKNKHFDAFAFNYLYDWDEHKKPTVVHRKTMVIRNDGCAKWVGAIHEDLEPTRHLEVQVVEGIERCHLTNSERSTENAKRNLEISELELEEKPNDPRSYWNLANSQIGLAHYQQAIATYEEFLKTSQSDDEKYLAHMRLAECYKNLEQRDDAIKQLQQAIGLMPSLPDAFYQLAFFYYSFSNWDKAEHYCLQGLIRKPNTARMIVFNPRDYDYNPMMLLARVYYQKNRPDKMLPLLKGCLQIYPKDEHLKRLVKEGEAEYKAMAKALTKAEKLLTITDKEKLKKELDRLPTDIKSHPTIVALRNTHFVKETSSGRDLVIYCGNTTRQWNPELFKTEGFGGSEEAVINLSRELAKLGWNVTVYNNCGHKPMVEEVRFAQTQEHPAGTTRYPVTYRPYWEWNYRDKQDVTILWRHAKPLDANINCPTILVDLHDVVPAGEFTPKRLEKVKKVMVKTNFHRSLFPNVPDEKIAVVGNGMDFSLLESDPPIKKDPYLVINTSSPDRSLDVLTKLWAEVKKRVPKAKLQWCYGWDGFVTAYQNDPKKMQWMKDTQKAMEEAGIEDLGRLTQAEVGKLYQKATILAYPTEFAEIDCLSVKKAQAAGCLPITTDFGALGETNDTGIKVHSTKTKDTWNRPYQFHFGLEDEKAQQDWVDMVCNYLEDIEDLKDTYGHVAKTWAHQFEWPKIAAKWNAIIKQ